jgi:hypothetical protein
MKSVCVVACLMVVGAARAQQVCDAGLSSPASRFEDHGDGTVTDKESRLMWMRCSAGQSWSAAGCRGEARLFGWESAQKEATEVNRGGRFFFNDWHVPQLRELATIAERQCANPRVNLTIFPSTPAGFYWTSSSRASKGDEGFSFALSFGAEGVKYLPRENSYRLRLVRSSH